MVSPVISEGFYTGGFIVREAPGSRSRDVGVVSNAGGTTLDAGAGLVLARGNAGTAVAAAKSGGNTGNGVFTIDATAPVLSGAKAGVYTVRCITAAANGGTFRVEDPDGYVLGDVLVAATFSDDIKFSIADGGTDFVVGDGFDVTVTLGNAQWVPFTNLAAQREIGILYARQSIAAAGTVKSTIITRAAEVNAAELIYDASLSGNALTAAKAAAASMLSSAGVILR